MQNTTYIMEKVKDFVNEFIADFRILEREGTFSKANDFTADSKIAELEFLGADSEHFSTGKLMKQTYNFDLTLTIFGPNAVKSEAVLEKISNNIIAKSVNLGTDWIADIPRFCADIKKIPFSGLEIESDLPLHEEKSVVNNLPTTSIVLSFTVSFLDVSII